MFGLGEYAFEVVSSWLVSLVTLGALVVVSTVKSRKVRAELAKLEGDRHGR